VAAPKALSAESLLPLQNVRENGSSHCVLHRHYFKREALYELVWTAPVSEIAKRLGVSDVGLAKLCRRAAIPIPVRGHWARIESGQHISPEPLPPEPQGLPELLRIRGRGVTSSDEGAASVAPSARVSKPRDCLTDRSREEGALGLAVGTNRHLL
jgi:hypothetical protein